MQDLFAKANALMDYGSNVALDVNRGGQLRAGDAHIIYHALTYPELLGDGRSAASGFVDVRRRPIGPYVALGAGTNEDWLAALRVVW